MAQIGNFSETLRYGEEAIQTATDRDYSLSVVFAYFAVGAVALIQGEFNQAIAALEHGLKVCEAAEIPVQRRLVISGLAAAYAFVGRFDEALRLLESTVDRSVRMTGAGSGQVPLGRSMGMVWEVETYMLAGRHSEAEDLARRLLAYSSKSKHRGSEAWLRCLLGDLLARHHPARLTHAEASYKEALSLAQELGMRPLQAHCYLGLGQIHSQSKIARVARSELHAASELYQSMGMPFWLARADLDLAAIS